MHISYLHYLYGDDMALNHVRQAAAALRGLGHRVDVHAMNLGPKMDAANGPATRGVRATLQTRLGRYLHEPKEVLWNARYVRKELALLRATPPDLLLVRDHQLTASCVPVARILDLPLVLEVNAPPEESQLYFDQYVHLPWLTSWSAAWKLRHADAVTVVSGPLKNHIAKRYGVAHEMITVVPNGADVEAFRPDRRRDAVLDDWGGDGPVIGFVGSFQKWHGTDLLADVVEQVGRARPATRFLFVGDGPEAAALREATAWLGPRALFTGNVAHARVPALVAGLDIGVLPEADFYRCPLKLIEWMAAGKAVVAPRYAPLEELIAHGLDGLLFPPGDAQALTSAVLRLVDDTPWRRGIGAAAAACTRASRSWADNARLVLDACTAAIERHGRNKSVLPNENHHVWNQRHLRS